MIVVGNTGEMESIFNSTSLTSDYINEVKLGVLEEAASDSLGFYLFTQGFCSLNSVIVLLQAIYRNVDVPLQTWWSSSVLSTNVFIGEIIEP